MNTRIKKQISGFLEMGIIFLMALIIMMDSPLNLFVKNGNTGIDSSVFKTVSLYMRNGMMPYKDIFDHKGPLIYVLNYLGELIASYRGIWIIELAMMFLTLVLLYKTARLVCNKRYSFLVLITASSALFTYLQGGNFTEEYALLFIAAATYIFTDYFLNNKINCIRLILCGASCGAVFMLRMNMIAVWLVFCVVVVIFCVKDREWKKLGRFTGFFVLGFLLIVLPFLIWLISGNAFSDFIQDYLLFNFMYTGEGASVSIYNRYHAIIRFFNTPLMLSAFVAVLYMLKKRTMLTIGYAFYFAMSFFLLSMSGRAYPHYGMVLIPAIVYPLASLLSMMEKEGKTNKGLVILAGMYFMVFIALPPWLEGSEKLVENYAKRTESQERNDSVGRAAHFIKENTMPEDKITVWGNQNIYYVLTERLSASKYSYQFPIGSVNPDILDAYFDELSEHPPKLIVVTEKLGKMKEFLSQNDFQLLFEEEEIQIYGKE